MSDERWLLGILTLLAVSVCGDANNVFVVAPNTFRLSAEETVAVMVAHGEEEVELYLQDLPNKQNIFSKTKVKVSEGDPLVVKMRVNPEDIPDLDVSSKQSRQYVLLVAKGKRIHKEVKVLVTFQSGYLFIQTDKPIYTPKDTVHVRIIPLNEDMLLDKNEFILQIRNPQNVTVDYKPSSKLIVTHGFYTYNFKIPEIAMEGQWSLDVQHANKVLRNETITFEIKEYSLPTFEVKLEVPEVILPADEVIDVKVEAKYVYGQPVNGTVKCIFSVISEFGKTIDLAITPRDDLENGMAKCTATQKSFQEHNEIGWFPGLAGKRLMVTAVVTERATGDQEKSNRTNTLFSNTKYLIDFRSCLKQFHLGHFFTVQADVKEVTGRTAPNVDVRITVRDQNGKLVKPNIPKGESTSDEEGRVVFLLPTNSRHSSLDISIETKDPKLDDNSQGRGILKVHRYASNNFIALSRVRIGEILKVGKHFTVDVLTNPPNIPVSYIVTSGGHVLTLGSVDSSSAAQRPLTFTVTDQMVPSLRITLFAVHGGKTLTDSVKMNVEHECRKQAKIRLSTSFVNPQPNDRGKVIVHGTPDTVVGVIAVDKAVYALRNKGLLTKDKMFSKMAEHDLGCGPGGGPNSDSILSNAGLVVFSDSSTAAPDRLSCTERKLRKREIKENLGNDKTVLEKMCCELGERGNNLTKTCFAQATIVRTYYSDDTCAQSYLDCCLSARSSTISYRRTVEQNGYCELGKIEDSTGLSCFNRSVIIWEYTNSSDNAKAYLQCCLNPKATSGNDQQGVNAIIWNPDDEDLDGEDIKERTNFQETWMFYNEVIGADNKWEKDLNLPDSITSWVIQAVGVHPRQGMCVADPIDVNVFKNVFIQLKMPYSVVRNEQIEIKATIFNYKPQLLNAAVTMLGVEGICSEAPTGLKGERKKIQVAGNGGAETVTFAILPLEIGEFPITIEVRSDDGNDKITKPLNVVAEGILHVEDIVIDIDPSNIKKKSKRFVSEKYTTNIDPENHQQQSIVNLTASHSYIPGTESCIITATEGSFGPVVQTAINNPQRLIRMPVGCGEQNMALMAPTLYVYHYLKLNNQLTKEQETNAINFITEGYRRELTFRKIDGSYAAFPNRASSTWLTAFVAKIFCQAKQYIFIGEDVICSALEWLAEQQEADGSFTEKNPVIHQEMTGGIKGTVPMTAFVLNAFYTCNCKTVDLTKAKEDAVEYLTTALPAIRDPYLLSLTAYALSLTGRENTSRDAFMHLMEISNFDRERNMLYWGNPGTPLSVETTSFALLTNLIQKKFSSRIKVRTDVIVNWLNTQRTTEGSFWSTQDTVIALEALSSYFISSKNPEVNLYCNLTTSEDSRSPSTFLDMIDFKQEKHRVLRSIKLDKLGGSLHLDAVGTSVSTIGVQLRYNVPTSADEICKFEIDVKVSDAKEDKMLRQVSNVNFPDGLFNALGHNEEDNKKGLLPPNPMPHRNEVKENAVLPGSKYVVNITVCVKYLSQKDSNMALVDVGKFTGYKTLKTDLKRIEDDESIPVAHYEESNSNVVFYFDKISHKNKNCFWFRAAREYLVADMESRVVKVYDYYEPSQSCQTFISPNQHNPRLKIKQVGNNYKCLEGGCPKKQPFQKILSEPDVDKQRQEMLEMACGTKYDYVWEVKVHNVTTDPSSYQEVTVRVLSVLREGRESRSEVQNKFRFFYGRQTCENGKLEIQKKYYIMGVDQEPILLAGEKRYKYFLTQQTSILEIVNVQSKSADIVEDERKLQIAFKWLKDQLVHKNGCPH